MNLANELMRSAPRRRNEIPSRLVGSAHQVDKPDQRGLSPTRVRKTFRKAYPSNRRLGATAGLGLCWPKLMRSPVESAGQIVEQLLDLDFSLNELLLQRIGDDGLQRRPACVEAERQKIDLARLGQPGGVFGLQQQAVNFLNRLRIGLR